MADTTATATQHEAAATDHHPPHLKHYFVSSEQQFDAAKLGMWLFLITEILLFSGMFVAYAVYRIWHPEVFAIASTELNPWLGGLNTLVLLGSSLTVALAIHAAQTDKRRLIARYLVITVLLAGVFMVVKYFEYTHKFHLGIFPGASFAYEEMSQAYVPIFFSIYFVMTGIHGVHVIIGMGVLSWLAWRSHRGDFGSEYYTPIELSGLYWHLVDIIWIFLFPLLYLI